MKLSVVITTSNRLSLLKRSLQSVLSQTIPCEIVIVDNGSQDGTDEYVTQLAKTLPGFSDKQIKYCCNSQNLGHSQAVNQGVELAQGDWIKLLDDDDYLDPSCLEVFQTAVTNFPQAVICSCLAIDVNQEGVELRRTRQISSEPFFCVPQADIHYGMLLERFPFGTPVQVAFHRESFLRSGGWDLDFVVCDDIESWIKLACFGDAIFINRCLAYRTIWEGGSNQKFSIEHRLKVNLLVKEKIYQLVNEKYHKLLPSMAQIRHYLHLHWSLVALKQAKLKCALQLAFPAILLPSSWILLLKARWPQFSKQIHHAVNLLLSQLKRGRLPTTQKISEVG